MPVLARFAVIGLETFAKGIASGAGSNLGGRGSTLAIGLLFGADDGGSADLSGAKGKLDEISRAMATLNATALTQSPPKSTPVS